MRYFSDLFRDVFQIAYVTEDIDEATSYFESTLGTVKCDTHYGSDLEASSSSMGRRWTSGSSTSRSSMPARRTWRSSGR